MKKTVITSIVLSFLALGLGAEETETSIFDNIKADIYWKVGSSGIVENNVTEGNDASFGGMYAQINGNVVTDFFHVGAKAKMRLSSAECWDDLATYSSWDKAFLGISLPIYRPLWIYGGHGFVFTTPGSFFTILDDYGSGSRWGKDGLGFQVRGGFVTFGSSLTVPYSSSSSSAPKLKEKLQIGSGVNFDFNEFGLPLNAGISLIYNNAKNYDYDSATKTYDYGRLFRDERDYTAAFFAQFKPSRTFSIGGGYTINGNPVNTSSSFKHVANYNTADLAYSHVLTLISRVKIQSGEWLNLSVEAEGEGAKSFDNDYYSAYGALRFKQNIAGILNAYPQIMYYSIFNRENASYDRDSLVIYPRLSLEKGRHYFVAGFQAEHREVSENSYDWIWSIPFYYKFKL